MGRRFSWSLAIAAALILLITMGGRQTIGLFIAPLDEATGLGIVSISLAVAIGQLVWGVGPAGVRWIRRSVRHRQGHRARRRDAGGRAGADPVRAFGMGADRHPRRHLCVRRRGRQLVDSDRRRVAADRARAALERRRVYQCRRLARAVRVRAAGAAGDRRAGLGQRDADARRRDADDIAARLAAAATRAGRGKCCAHAEPPGDRAAAAAGGGGARPELLVAQSRLLHLRLSCRVSRHPSARRGQAVRAVAVDRGQFAGDHRRRQYRRQPRRRLARRPLPNEAPAVLDLSDPRRRGARLHDGAEDRDDLLRLRRRARA